LNEEQCRERSARFAGLSTETLAEALLAEETSSEETLEEFS
jgi:hypothetical protein